MKTGKAKGNIKVLTGEARQQKLQAGTQACQGGRESAL